jgi:hypothetical protein
MARADSTFRRALASASLAAAALLLVGAAPPLDVVDYELRLRTDAATRSVEGRETIRLAAPVP